MSESHKDMYAEGNDSQLNETEVTTLWSPESLQLAKEDIPLLQNLFRWLNRRKHCPLSALLTGKVATEIPSEYRREFLADVSKRFKPFARSVEATNLINSVIAWGNSAGLFSVCPLPIPFRIQKPASPFLRNELHALDLATELRVHLDKSIRTPSPLRRMKTPPTKLAQIALGEILISAILHGGLINTPALSSLLLKLYSEGNSALQCLGNRVFIELWFGYRGQENAEFRRWYPDPLSALLLMRMQKETVATALANTDPDRKSLTSFIWRCVSAYLRATQCRNSPKNISELLNAVTLDLSTRIPMNLVSYASRRIISHSIKPSAYRRLHGQPANAEMPVVEPTRLSPEAADPQKNRKESSRETASSLSPSWLLPIRQSISGNDRDVIINKLEVLLSEGRQGFIRGDVGELFAGFALRTFKQYTEKQLTTARGKVVSLATRLGGLLGTDISEYGDEEWAALFEETLSDAESSGLRRKLQRTLLEFQTYREQERGAPPFESPELFGPLNALVPVDANLISEQEFLRIREQFHALYKTHEIVAVGRQQADRFAELAWLIVTLSYRVGFRRMEVLKLQLNDPLFSENTEILLRPTESRRLKTKSSTRKNPLYALLDAEELRRLQTWVAERQNEEHKQPFSPFLFALPGSNLRFVPQDSLFKYLHQVMREVTGDPSIRFHHLRHSFASQCQLRLAAEAGGYLSKIHSVLPNYYPHACDGMSLRTRLGLHPRITRKDIWAVSALLGHSSPEVSLEHYIHHQDICLSFALSRSGIRPNRSALIELSNASPSQVSRHADDGCLDSWIAHLYRTIFPDRIEIPPSNQATLVMPLQKAQADAGVSLLRIWRLLFLRFTNAYSAEQLAERFEFPVERLQNFINTSEAFAKLLVSDRGENYRHRFMFWSPDKRNTRLSRRIACPLKPHLASDREKFDQFAKIFRSHYLQNIELFRTNVSRYVHNATNNFDGLIFRMPDEPGEAIAFLKFLKVLEVAPENIQFISFDVTSSRSRQAAAWRAALSLHPSIKMTKRPPPNGRKDWACPWLGIQPAYPNNKGELTGSAGFRFFMVMCGIAMGLDEA